LWFFVEILKHLRTSWLFLKFDLLHQSRTFAIWIFNDKVTRYFLAEPNTVLTTMLKHYNEAAKSVGCIKINYHFVSLTCKYSIDLPALDIYFISLNPF